MATPQSPSNDNALPAQDIPLTDAERAALDGFDDNGNAITPPAATDDGATPPADPAATPATAEPAAPAAPAAPDPTLAAPAATDPAQPPAEPATPPPAASAPSPIYTPQVNPGDARDFTAELKALKGKYAAGEVDDDEYELQREDIIGARAVWNAKAEISEQLSQQGWQANVRSFLGMPENDALLRSEDLRQFWQRSMELVNVEAAAAGQVLTDWDLLSRGRDRLYQQLGISTTTVPPAPTPTPPPPAQKPNQAPDLSTVPPAIGRAPAAAPSGAKTTAEQLAGSDSIMDIEAFFAGQTEQAADELLRTLPGAFTD